MVFQIRQAEVRDARGIAVVNIRGWQIGYRDFFSRDFLDTFDVEVSATRWKETLASAEHVPPLVADEDEAILGLTSYWRNDGDLGDEVGEVYLLYVDPDHWNRGIGSALLAAAQAGLSEAGFTSAVLWTFGPNARARAFYEHRGWRVDGATKPHSTGVELVRYKKVLTPAS